MGCGCHLFDVRKNEDDTPKMMNGVEENNTKSVTVTEAILLFLSLFGSHLFVFSYLCPEIHYQFYSRVSEKSK